MQGTISESLNEIATQCCIQLCKHYDRYVEVRDSYLDPEEAYERLCIEHCEDCPLNKLGVWQ